MRKNQLRALTLPEGKATALPPEKTDSGRPPLAERPGTAIPREALSPAQREPNPLKVSFREAQYLEFVRKRPCSFCGNPNTEPHHVFRRLRGISEAGMAEKGSDYLAIPICRACHARLHEGSLKVADEDLLVCIVINLICFLHELRGQRGPNLR